MNKPHKVASVPLIAGLSEIAARYEVVLSDIWGVVHNGRESFDAATDALAAFRRRGGTVILITNAPRPSGPIVEQLVELRVPRQAYDGIVTSGDVTMGLIAARGSAPVHHIGPPRDLSLFEAAARLLAIDPVNMPVRTDDEIETAIAGLGPERAGVVVTADSFMAVHFGTVISSTTRHNVPAICEARELAKEGGLISYGADYADIFRRAASYVDRILRGEKPADLPVQAPIKFELAVNLKTARALGPLFRRRCSPSPTR